jgi:transposase-like protein
MLEQDLLRNQRKRLAVLRHYEEVTHNVSKTCRYYGISRMAFYRWQHRYHEFGLEGLKDRSRRPHHSPVNVKYFSLPRGKARYTQPPSSRGIYRRE